MDYFVAVSETFPKYVTCNLPGADYYPDGALWFIGLPAGTFNSRGPVLRYRQWLQTNSQPGIHEVGVLFADDDGSLQVPLEVHVGFTNFVLTEVQEVPLRAT